MAPSSPRKNKNQHRPSVRQGGAKTAKNPATRKVSLNPDLPSGALSAFYLEKYGLWIALSLVFFLSLLIFQKFILGNAYYFFKDIGSDTFNGSYPNFACAIDYFKSDGFPLWSFRQGMGQNIMWPTFMDPFFGIIYFAGKNNILASAVWMELAKILITSLLIYNFFRLLKFSFTARITGTLLYCFSGFMIVGGSWFQFSTEACYLALTLLAFEKLYQQNSWYLFPLAFALIPVFQPFNVYLYGFFLVIYFLFRYFSDPRSTWKKFAVISLKMAGLGLLGILISSFFSLSILQMIFDSPRVGGNSTYFSKLRSFPVFSFDSAEYYTTVLGRYFSNDLLGNGSGFKGWQNYLEAPMFYIGLFPLLLLPQFFTLKDKRLKIAASILLLLFIIPVIFPYFRYAFWLFSGDYYRGLSFFVSLVILILSLSALTEIGKTGRINLYILLPTAVVLLILLYAFMPVNPDLVNNGIRSAIRDFILLYTSLLILYNFSRKKIVLLLLLTAGVAVELIYLNYTTVNDRDAYTRLDAKERIGYNDYTLEAIAFIKSREKQPFYRVNKDFFSNPAMHNSLNNAKVQGYYGTLSYHSFNQKYYIRFLEEMNIIKKGEESQSRWAQGLINHPLLLEIASNKYHLSAVPNSVTLFKNLGYDSVAKYGNVRVYENRHFLPLGFTYDTYIPLSQFRKLSMTQKDMTMQHALVTEEPIDPPLAQLKAFKLSDTAVVYSVRSYFKDIIDRKADTLAISSFSQNRIRGNIQLKEFKLLFFSIPFDKGWHTLVDHKKVKPLLCNIGFMGIPLDKGKHEVELYFRPAYFYYGLIVSLAGVFIYILLLVVTIFGKKKNASDTQ